MDERIYKTLLEIKNELQAIRECLELHTKVIPSNDKPIFDPRDFSQHVSEGVHCAHCKKMIPKTDKFCPYCGRAMKTKSF